MPYLTLTEKSELQLTELSPALVPPAARKQSGSILGYTHTFTYFLRTHTGPHFGYILVYYGCRPTRYSCSFLSFHEIVSTLDLHHVWQMNRPTAAALGFWSSMLQNSLLITMGINYVGGISETAQPYYWFWRTLQLQLSSSELYIDQSVPWRHTDADITR